MKPMFRIIRQTLLWIALFRLIVLSQASAQDKVRGTPMEHVDLRHASIEEIHQVAEKDANLARSLMHLPDPITHKVSTITHKDVEEKAATFRVYARLHHLEGDDASWTCSLSCYRCSTEGVRLPPKIRTSSASSETWFGCAVFQPIRSRLLCGVTTQNSTAESVSSFPAPPYWGAQNFLNWYIRCDTQKSSSTSLRFSRPQYRIWRRSSRPQRLRPTLTTALFWRLVTNQKIGNTKKSGG